MIIFRYTNVLNNSKLNFLWLILWFNTLEWITFRITSIWFNKNFVVLMENKKDNFILNFLGNFECRIKENWRAIIACYKFKLMRWISIKRKSEIDNQVKSTRSMIIHMITFSIIKKFSSNISSEFISNSLEHRRRQNSI